MKTVRNVVLLTTLGVLYMTGQGDAFGFPPYFDCPAGCECEQSEGYGSVSIDCPDVAGVWVCEELIDNCIAYCDFDYEAYVNGIPPGNYSCWLNSFHVAGCYPHGLEPPTSGTCSCLCW